MAELGMSSEVRQVLTESLHTHQSAATLADKMGNLSASALGLAEREKLRKLIEMRADRAINRILAAFGDNEAQQAAEGYDQDADDALVNDIGLDQENR